MRENNNVGGRVVSFAAKMTGPELALLKDQSKAAVEKLVLGTNENTKDGFNHNLDYACPHVKIQKASTGTGSVMVDALSERPIKERTLTLTTLEGKVVDMKVYIFKCTECKGEVPRFIPADTTGMTMKQIQEFNATVFEMASIVLQTEMTLRASYNNTLRLPGFVEGAESRGVPTGNTLIELLKSEPQARFGRFSLLQALKNLKDSATIMSKGSGSASGAKRVFTQGRGLKKKSGSIFDAAIGMKRSNVKRRPGQDVEGSMSYNDASGTNRFDGRDDKRVERKSSSQDGLKMEE